MENIKLSFDYESDEVKDIQKCLMTLYSTKAGTIPLDRNFGINPECIDAPLPVAQNLLAAEIIEKTELYEPRVIVSEVTFEYDAENGTLISTVHLEEGDEIEDE